MVARGKDTEDVRKTVPSPAVSTQQGFTIDKGAGKSLSEQEHANRVNRIVSSYLAATPSQQRAGSRWYAKAHRSAVHVAAGENPGVPGQERRQRSRMMKNGRPSDEAVTRTAGVIARTSPSMPAGMSWTHNPKAAYEVGKLSDEQASDINRGKPGARYVEGNTSLQHAGEYAIVHAHAIHKGEVTPERDLNEKVGAKGNVTEDRQKIGSFHRNIVNPMHSREVTIDARSAGLAGGKRIGFKDVSTQVGKMQGTRYKDYERAYQEATDIINAHLDQAARSAGRTRTSKVLPHMVQATTWTADKEDLEKKMTGQAVGGVAKGAHLHAGPGGRALTHRDFPAPVGQERTQSAR